MAPEGHTGSVPGEFRGCAGSGTVSAPAASAKSRPTLSGHAYDAASLSRSGTTRIPPLDPARNGPEPVEGPAGGSRSRGPARASFDAHVPGGSARVVPVAGTRGQARHLPRAVH